MKFLSSILLCFLIWNVGMTQCTISGPGSLGINETGVYSIPSNLGQCSNCYDWEIVSGNGTIIGSNTNNTVSIRKNDTGNLTIRATYFSGGNCVDCTLTINNTPCGGNYDITISEEYLVGLNSNRVVIYATGNLPPFNSSAVYDWTVTYDSGPPVPFVSDYANVTVQIGFDQSITAATVSGSYQGCVFTDNIDFDPPIEYPFFNLDSDAPQNTFATQSIEVYPNPTTGELNVIGLPLEGHTISILDLQGKEIISNAPLDQNLNISDQARGIYQYLINNANGIVKSGKILKE